MPDRALRTAESRGSLSAGPEGARTTDNGRHLAAHADPQATAVETGAHRRRPGAGRFLHTGLGLDTAEQDTRRGLQWQAVEEAGGAAAAGNRPAGDGDGRRRAHDHSVLSLSRGRVPSWIGAHHSADSG